MQRVGEVERAVIVGAVRAGCSLAPARSKRETVTLPPSIATVAPIRRIVADQRHRLRHAAGEAERAVDAGLLAAALLGAIAT